MSRENHCTVIFVRYPEKGRVKSRLAAAFDEGFIVTLYEAFVKDLLATLARRGHPFRIAFTPAEREADICRLFGRHDRFPQSGADLGERMKNALQHCFAEGFASAVIIGSDMPDLPPELLGEAGAALEDHDAVIGPALDGGYYLIGFRKETLVPDVFKGIAWGSGGVFAETMARLARAGSRVHVLDRLRDVDTPEDLRDLIRRHRKTPFARSRTMACLAAVHPAGRFGEP
ncbi:MAG: TIGR04282 family arsenosugar biosynthesis glycosyltransferase [Syntrophales bacterium]